MRKNIHIILSSLLLVVCLSGCETYNINRGNRNALVIKPAKQSMVDSKLLSKKGTMIISIGSAFMGGGIPDIKEGSAQYSHFYREKYPQGYNLGEAEPLAWIDGFFHNGVEYTKPGQQIDRICILGLDESLGLGSNLIIPMNQGKYENGHDLIKEVRINPYQLSAIDPEETDIDIVIISKAGDVINLTFANELTPFDGFI